MPLEWMANHPNRDADNYTMIMATFFYKKKRAVMTNRRILYQEVKMSLRNVINNIEKKGVYETYRIHLCRKYNLVQKEKEVRHNLTEKEVSDPAGKYQNLFDISEQIAGAYNTKDSKVLSSYHKKLQSLVVMRLIKEANGWNTGREQQLIDEMITESANCSEQRLEKWNATIMGLEDKNYKIELKSLFIKALIPNVYNTHANSGIDTRKIVFLQPRRGLNQSFKYIYRKMAAGGDYDPQLIELHRGDVPMTEQYVNALIFASEAATAKAIMIHTSSEYLGYIDIRPETKVIQLWHGCGVIKHLGLTAAGKPRFKTMADYEEFPEYNKYDLVTIAGEGLRPVFEDFMGREKDDPVIQAMGVSRTDEFFDRGYIDNCYRKLYEKIPEAKEKKIILYAPTYRGKSFSRSAPRALDVAKFAEKLSDDYILIIKHHQTAIEIPEIPEEYRDRFAFDMTRGKGMDINELMTIADICISDYSSVVFEFSLFERPIIFFMYDLEDYRDARGMYYSYEELAECGPIFKTNEEIIDYILNIDERFDKSKVTEFKAKFMSACDGHATERILNFINQE